MCECKLHMGQNHPQLEKSKQPWVPSKNYGARNRVFSQKQSGARKRESINKHKGRDQGKPRRFTTNPFLQQSVLLSPTVVPGSTLENWTVKETPSLPPIGLIVSWRELVTVCGYDWPQCSQSRERQRLVRATKMPPPMRHIFLPMLISSFLKPHSYSVVRPYQGNKSWEIPESTNVLHIASCDLSALQQGEESLRGSNPYRMVCNEPSACIFTPGLDCRPQCELYAILCAVKVSQLGSHPLWCLPLPRAIHCLW